MHLWAYLCACTILRAVLVSLCVYARSHACRESGFPSSTAYFAAIMSSLEQTQKHTEDSLTAFLYLLGILFPQVCLYRKVCMHAIHMRKLYIHTIQTHTYTHHQHTHIHRERREMHNPHITDTCVHHIHTQLPTEIDRESHNPLTTHPHKHHTNTTTTQCLDCDQVPPAVLHTKLEAISNLFVGILSKHGDHTLMAKSILSCCGILLRGVDRGVWAYSHTLNVFRPLLVPLLSPPLLLLLLLISTAHISVCVCGSWEAREMHDNTKEVSESNGPVFLLCVYDVYVKASRE